MPSVLTNASCRYIVVVPDEAKCEFVINTKDCDSDTYSLPAYYFMYCIFNGGHYAALIMLIIVLYFFMIIGIVADDYLCPVMAALSSLLKLSENIAGVTILAFANGTPDLMSVISGLQEGSTDTVFCTLIGSGIFNSTVVAGCIILAQPFVVEPVPLVRDCGFYLISVLLLFFFFNTRTYTWIYALVFIGIYLAYLLLITTRWIMELHEKGDGQNMDYIVYEVKEETIITDVFKEDRLDVWHEIKMMWPYLKLQLKPFEYTVWKRKNMLSKIYCIIQAPNACLLKLLIPQVDYSLTRNGWCKPLYMINVIVLPVFANLYFSPRYVLRYMAADIGVGIAMAAVIYVITSRREKPRYHNIIIVHSLFCAFILIYVVVNNIVALLNAMASKFAFSNSIMPLTVLAWGNSIGDFVTDVNLSRSGLPRMAIAGCFGGPLFNLVFNAGFLMMYYFIQRSVSSISVTYGQVGPAGVTFLSMALGMTLVILPCLQFQARKSYAVFLLILYVEFLMFVMFDELGFMYSFGEKEHKDVH